jgi:hypothetical protein
MHTDDDQIVPYGDSAPFLIESASVVGMPCGKPL